MRKMFAAIILAGFLHVASADNPGMMELVWTRANIAYNAGKYKEAAELYVQASQYMGVHVPPRLVFNNAQAKRKAGMKKSALNAYKAYLLIADKDDPIRLVAEKWVYILSGGK